MAKMKDIKAMNEKDLSSLVEEKRETIRSFRFGAGARDVKSVREARKDIARALTALNTKAKEANKGDAN